MRGDEGSERRNSSPVLLQEGLAPFWGSFDFDDVEGIDIEVVECKFSVKSMPCSLSAKSKACLKNMGQKKTRKA